MLPPNRTSIPLSALSARSIFTSALAAVRGIALPAATLLLAGCAAAPFPVFSPTDRFDDGLTAQQLFDRSLAVHGGDLRDGATDLNLAIDGEWKFLIKRIQPLVTDFNYRIRSEERLSPREPRYTVNWTGPAGTKQVVRTPTSVEVYYNGVKETDAKKISASAMTSDAFQLFHGGLSFLRWRGAALARLPDVREDGRSYQRVLATLRPGFGDSAEDLAVLWLDAQTLRLYRVHITLEGFETTKGAHVDVTFLEYRQVGRFLLPVRFLERVIGPIGIDAHRWWVTGVDLDRGWSAADISGAAYTGSAAAPAKPLQ